MKYPFFAIPLLTLILSCCAYVPAATASPASTQAPNEEFSIEVIGGNDESLGEFIRHWSPPYSPDPSRKKITYYIGDVPKDLPYDLPAPDDSRLIGSVTGGWLDYMLIFDTSLTPESVHEFYAQALKVRGWKVSPAEGGGGMLATPEQGYCYGENEAFLSVAAQSISAVRTKIQLILFTTPDAVPCKGLANTDMSIIYDHIPALSPPKGLTMGMQGANMGESEAQTTLTLVGDLSPTEVLEFYNDQLMAAGWKMPSHGENEGAAWSNWTFKDIQGNAWIGMLITVKASPGSNTLYAILNIEKIK